MRSPLSRRGDEQSLERRAFLALQDVLDDPHSAQRCHPEEAKLTKDLAPGTGADPRITADTSAAFRLRRRGCRPRQPEPPLPERESVAPSIARRHTGADGLSRFTALRESGILTAIFVHA